MMNQQKIWDVKILAMDIGQACKISFFIAMKRISGIA